MLGKTENSLIHNLPHAWAPSHYTLTHGLPAPSFPLGTYNFFVQGHTDTDTETLLHISSPQTLSPFLSLSSQSPSRTTSLLWPYSHSQSSICMHIRPSTEPPSHTTALTALYSASPLNTFFPHTGSLTDSHLQSLLTHILSHTLLPRLRPASHSFYTQCPFNTLHTSRVTHTHSFSLHPPHTWMPSQTPFLTNSPQDSLLHSHPPTQALLYTAFLIQLPLHTVSSIRSLFTQGTLTPYTQPFGSFFTH